MTLAPSRFLRAAAVASGIALLASADAAPPDPVPPSIRAAALPNAPVLGLKYFRVDPGGGASIYELLVIPVRFPEDAQLGGGEREGLLAGLKGDDPQTLEGFYRAITFDRIRMRVTLAPVVTAEHARTWYTSEGEGNRGFGLDVEAYPHNSRGLVEEVTAKVTTSVDLRRFDNTGDGIVDGLLLLHSGPAAPEAVTGATPKTLMAAHSFTLDEPVLRGDAWVFPYAVASTRDPLGPWAHEAGHLLGLVDLYVPNSFCPGEGLGVWSLMATGANQDGGESPTGLDAFSLQLLGFAADRTEGGWVTLGRGRFLRVFRAGEAQGREYFLIERRSCGVEPGLPEGATVIYSVDETRVDNRTCGHPLVEVRGLTCVGGNECELLLTDLTVPDLRDRAGEGTNLSVFLEGERALVAYGATPPMGPVSLRLLDPVRSSPADAATQKIELTLRPLNILEGHSLRIEIAAPEGSPLCVTAPGGTPEYLLEFRQAIRDTSWVVGACAGGDPPVRVEEFEITFTSPQWPFPVHRTVALAVNQSGLGDDRLAEFISTSLDPGRDDPWRWDEAAGSWSAREFDVLADAELVSPWFAVPDNGVLILDHEWRMDAVAPDLALDAGEISLETPFGAEEDLKPARGWGHRVERGVGNALGGRDALSGAGSRLHVLDLSGHAGETVRIKLRAAGDVEAGDGLWTIRRAVVNSRDWLWGFRVRINDERELRVVPTGIVPVGARLALYSGPAPLTPGRLLASGVWEDAFTTRADGDPGALRRFDLVWTAPPGEEGGGMSEILVELPPDPRALHPPYPNPLRPGEIQNWSVEVPERSAPGVYDFLLVDAAGRRVAGRRIRFDLLGRRTVQWDGRDFLGRPVPAGVYFLQVRTPLGGKESRRLVVLP